MKITIIPANEYRRERWVNLNGWSRHIVSSQSAQGLPDWQLTIHEISTTAQLPTQPGFMRELVLLHGEGITINQSVDLLPPFGKQRIDAQLTADLKSIGDRTVDILELIWRIESHHLELLHRPLVGSMVFFASNQQWLIHVLAGQARFVSDHSLMPLSIGDTALIDGVSPTTAENDPRRAVLDGGGELLIARISKYCE